MARTVNLAAPALLLLAGSLLLLWFIILSGVTRTSPLWQTYFLRADTSGMEGARAVSQWTYLHVCGLDNDDCGPARPALPLGDAWATNGRNVPAELMGSHGGGTTSTKFWDASLGRYAFGFGWGSWTALLISTVLFCMARRKRKDAAPPPVATGRRNWRAPWKRGTVNRTGYEGRRVKEEYV
ncbi:Eisosomes component [Collariella sp. IMI 366227]|nr:Eisosomes component [Collariella sp. IMI 366227]